MHIGMGTQCSREVIPFGLRLRITHFILFAGYSLAENAAVMVGLNSPLLIWSTGRKSIDIKFLGRYKSLLPTFSLWGVP